MKTCASAIEATMQINKICQTIENLDNKEI